MPTSLPAGEKQAFIDLVKAAPFPGGMAEADRLQDILNNYEDVRTAIYRELELFAANNAYLTQAIAVFNQNQLQAVGIWVGVAQTSPPITDPWLIINSTYTEVIINPSSPPVYQTLAILGTSTIGSVVLAAGTTLQELYVGPGSVVDVLDASLVISSPPTATAVGTVWLPFLRSKPSRLNSVAYDSMVNNVVVDEGSYYGGISENPDVACADIVTDVSATEVTKNGVYVSWTPPANYLFVNTFYKKMNSSVWIKATTADGEFVGDSGFVFRNLDTDTWYDFKISTTCFNGGVASMTITTKTVCCGAGTTLSLYKNCPIKMLISSTPDSPPLGQTLCNGVTIALHYPPGPTITIPYLATVNCAVLEPFVVDNANYQLMPYNAATGTWDATGTPVGSFIEGNVVTVNVSIPVWL